MEQKAIKERLKQAIQMRGIKQVELVSIPG